MREIMTAQAASCDLKELVRKFIPESIGKEIEKATSSIYPLQNVFIRKVKILKAPKFDLGKLMEACLLLYMLLIMCLMFWSLNYYKGFFHTIFISAARILRLFMYISNYHWHASSHGSFWTIEFHQLFKQL